MLVVEDDSLVAALLSSLLTGQGFQVVTASNAAEAMDQVRTFDPDVALLDINLGSGPSGLSLGKFLSQRHPDIGLVFLTRFPDPHSAGLEAWEVPEGSTFLSKSLIKDVSLLNEAIENVLSTKKTDIRGFSNDNPLAKLTKAQIAVLTMVASGMTNAAIAAARETKERTVEKRLQTIYAALDISMSGDINPRIEAARIYIANAGMPQRQG